MSIAGRWARCPRNLVEAYENKHYDFGPADPVEVIKFRMEQEGLTPRDLQHFLPTLERPMEALLVSIGIVALVEIGDNTQLLTGVTRLHPLGARLPR